MLRGGYVRVLWASPQIVGTSWLRGLLYDWCFNRLETGLYRGVDLFMANRRRARGRVPGPPASVEACPGLLKRLCHPADLEVCLLRRFQFKPFGRGGFDAKKAAAFPGNLLSLCNWSTSRCRRFSLACSSTLSLSVGSLACLERLGPTQRSKSCSPIPSLRVACAIRRTRLDHQPRGFDPILRCERSVLPALNSDLPSGTLPRTPARYLRCPQSQGKPNFSFGGSLSALAWSAVA